MLFLKSRNTAKITIAKAMIQLTISSQPSCRIRLSENEYVSTGIRKSVAIPAVDRGWGGMGGSFASSWRRGGRVKKSGVAAALALQTQIFFLWSAGFFRLVQFLIVVARANMFRGPFFPKKRGTAPRPEPETSPSASRAARRSPLGCSVCS